MEGYCDMTATVDSDKGYFRYSELKPADVKYLLAKGYKTVERKGLSSAAKEKFMIKPRFNESDAHCFVVYDIANYLGECNVKTNLFTTRKPDITFEADRTTMAIEIETGHKILKDRKSILEKIKNLKKDYGFFFFVVTNRNLSKRYRKLAKTIDLRYLKTFFEKGFY